MKRSLCLAVTLTLVLFPAHAQQERKLSLEEAIKIAVERNLDIQLQRITVNDRQIGIDLATVQYEPTLSLNTSRDSQSRASNDANEGSAGATITTSSGSYSATFSKNERYGLNWSISAGDGFAESDAQNSFGKTFGGNMTFNVEQQLLRGFSLDPEVMRNDEYVAESNLAIAKTDLQTRLVNVLQTVEDAYWDLVSAKEQAKVARQSLDLAQQLYEQNRIKIDVGTMAPIELVNAEAQVASREVDIINADSAVLAAEDRLKTVLNLPVSEWTQTMIPTDELTTDAIETNFERDLGTAMTARPEIISDMESERQAQIGLKVARNELLPTLSISGRYQVSGNASPIPIGQDENGNFIFSTVSNNEVWEEIINQDLPSWNVTLAATIRPFNKQGRLNKARAEMTLRQNAVNADQTRLLILQDVRAAIRDLQSGFKAIQASENSLKFQRENLKAEEQKFKNGLSTNYEVQQAQNSLATAESNLINSRVTYRKNVVNYYKALGTLNKIHKISIK